jgi:hypothetical protein
MRVKKFISSQPYIYNTKITIQIGDINYGGHVGNERYLLFAQETRMRFLKTLGLSEVNFGPYGLILAEAGVEYLAELFQGDEIIISIAIDNITRASFDCYYTIEKNQKEKTIPAAYIKTSMICFDYTERKVKSIPEDIRKKLTELPLTA